LDDLVFASMIMGMQLSEIFRWIAKSLTAANGWTWHCFRRQFRFHTCGTLASDISPEIPYIYNPLLTIYTMSHICIYNNNNDNNNSNTNIDNNHHHNKDNNLLIIGI
jgi:hypothetical protein